MNTRLTVTAAIATAAASTSLVLLVSGVTWFFAGVGAIIVVAAVGTATRQRALRALPAVVCLLCALVAVALYLNLVYTGRSSFLRVLPTPHSLNRLWQLAVTGLRDTHSDTTPAPAVAGIELLATGGIAIVAALTDLIAVRLRRCALAGLPLLVLFSVPIATDAVKNSMEGAVVFCIGMAGYLALLTADGRERLRLWGRLITPWNAAHPGEQGDEPGAGAGNRVLAASGRRIGLAAVVVALFAPLLIPGLHAHKWFSSGHGAGPGLGTGPGGVNASVSPLVQMTNDLRQAKSTPVLRYHTTDAHPQYLVEYVLDRMSDNAATWVPAGRLSAVSAGRSLPPVPGLASDRWPEVETTVHMQTAAPLGGSYLPVPYAPRLLTVPKGGLLVNDSTLMVYSPLTSLTRISYTVTSIDVTPTSAAQFAAAAVKPAGMAAYLSVPAPLRSLRSLARQVVGTASTPYAEAQALQAWFRSGRFTYNVNAKEPDTAGALRNFLEVTKSGYCQQFAFAMTVLARLLGIPARMAVGFDAGSSLGKGNYQVNTGDAHAWTQLYFSGLGWLTWDATPPGNAVGQTNVETPGYTIHGPTGGGGTLPGGHNTVPPSRSVHIPRINEQPLGGGTHPGADGAGTAHPAGRHAGRGPPVPLVVLAALVAAALLVPRTARSLTRSRRWRTGRGEAGRAHAAWGELLDDLTDYGIGHGPAETPRAVVTRVTAQQRLTGPVRDALDRIAGAEERASYARQPGPSATLPADVATVRAALSASVTRAARWRARLVPPSSVEWIRHALAHALDAFGWLEVATTRLTGRLRTRAGQV